MENYEIGRFLRMKREALGYSREKVCGLCGGAFSTKTLSRMEKGKTKINRNTVQELLKLYHQRSHASCASMELVHISAGQMYNDILALMCRKDYKEAERRLELFERHVDGASKQDVQYVEVLRQGLKYFTGETKTGNGDVLSFFQDLLGQMVPQDADLGKWPLTHLELNIYLTYLNVLAIEGQYGKIIPIARKLLANIEQGYHNPWIFVDYHGCFTHKLIRSLHKEGQCDEIRELAEKSIDICTSFGNISNTYLLQSELLWYYEEYDFFNDPNLKEQCFETAKKMYYLSLMCEDKNNYSYFKAYLGRVYGYMELLY